MWIDEWLFQEGKTIGSLAEDVGISRDYLSMIIHGKRRGSPDVAKKISEATNGEVSIHEIPFGDREERKKPPKNRK